MTTQNEMYNFVSKLADIENASGLRHLESIIPMEQAATIWDKGTNYGKHDFRVTTAWTRLDEPHRRALAYYLSLKVQP